MKTIISSHTDQTLELGEKIGRAVTCGIRIALKGELGAGKTTFVQGLAKGLGVSEKYYITSPTFNIINEYTAGKFTLCHLDLYRLESCEDLEDIGFDDLIEDMNVIVVEWPGILEDICFRFDLEIHFNFDEHYNRIISVFASGQSASNLLSTLSL